MQQVVCPNCSAELGEAEDEGDRGVLCPFCGEVFDVVEVEDLAEMYRRQEEEDRDRWIPHRTPRPHVILDKDGTWYDQLELPFPP